MNATRLSPDGLYYWDGGRWLTTLSADGRHRWNGTEWAPLAAGSADPHGHAPEPAGGRGATTWTRPIQFAVAGWYGVQALWVAALPFWFISTMTRYADEMNRRTQQLHPGTPTPPPDLMSSTNTGMTAVFYLGIVIGLAVAVVAIVGAVRRWTWAYYGILALLGLEVIWLVLGLAGTLIISLATSAMIGQSMGPPAWMLWEQLAFAIPSAALFAWMVMAMVQRRPWAMKNATASTSAAS